MAYIFNLPPEILDKVAQASLKQDIPALRFSHPKLYHATNRRFVVEFFTHRKHEISLKSLKLLCAISKHEWTADDQTKWGFCHQLQKITFVSSVKEVMEVNELLLLQTAFENIARLGHSISLGLCRSNLGEDGEAASAVPGIALGHIASAVVASRLDVNALSIELDSLKKSWGLASLFDSAVSDLAYVPMDNGKPTLKQGLDIDVVYKRGEDDDTSVHYKHKNRSLIIKRSDYSTPTGQPGSRSRRCFDMGSFGFFPAAMSTTPIEILRLEQVFCGHELLLDMLNTLSTTLKVVQFDNMLIFDDQFRWDRVLETLAGFDLEGLVLKSIAYSIGERLMGMSDSVAWTGKQLIRNGLQRLIDDFQDEPEESGEWEDSEGEDSGDGEESDELEGQGEDDV